MGCCGSRLEDPDIKNAESIEALIKVMKDKRDKTIEEQKQIKAHLVDKKNLVTTSDINGLSREDLERRVPYLGIIANYFKESVELLEENQSYISLKETKEYMLSIYEHYLKCNEPEEIIKTDMAAFKQYLHNLKKK